jgi:hypothetical protein
MKNQGTRLLQSLAAVTVALTVLPPLLSNLLPAPVWAQESAPILAQPSGGGRPPPGAQIIPPPATSGPP